MELHQLLDCRVWQFSELPPFKDGEMSPLFADCGTGTEPEKDTASHSFIHIFFGVTADAVTHYAHLLCEAGFEKLYESTLGGNLFYQFQTSGGLLYISLLNRTGTARFILDRCKTLSPARFGYDSFAPTRPDTVFAQYSLHYDAMIRGVTCDCGMNYVFRLRDNSLIIIDGGEFEQATDLAVSDYMAFLRELTGSHPGEKIRISLWLCTHAHNDHCDFMSKLLRFHAEEIELERAAFNFPAEENVRHSPSVADIKLRINDRFPKAKYIKLHAGQTINIANAKLDILLSAEDTTGLCKEEPFPGTNDTSVIFTVKADGKTALFLADCGNDNGRVLTLNYVKNDLACDFLQAAHHGINKIEPVYEHIDTSVVLLPQCRMNMNSRFGDIYKNLCLRYGEDNILFAHDFTDLFALKDGRYTHSRRPHTGVSYDNSEW